MNTFKTHRLINVLSVQLFTQPFELEKSSYPYIFPPLLFSHRILTALLSRTKNGKIRIMKPHTREHRIPFIAPCDDYVKPWNLEP